MIAASDRLALVFQLSAEQCHYAPSWPIAFGGLPAGWNSKTGWSICGYGQGLRR
ncbi:MAG: hypothetical protein LBV47_04950 [Bacteroidales bacterium]|nr:hypothetical protein [Bacteroidales bacterium]